MTTRAEISLKEFAWRRVHSLLGLWIVLFLIEHMLTNSQAALLFGESGMGFIRAVNFIKNLPYLPVIEILLIGVPILFHGILGIRILMGSKINAFPGSKSRPNLTKYARNHAYSWQRITSWILLVGIIAHVGFMRFYMYPAIANMGKQSFYFVRIGIDPGLYAVAGRLKSTLYDEMAIEKVRERVKAQEKELEQMEAEVKRQELQESEGYSKHQADLVAQYQVLENKKIYLKALTKKRLSKGQVIAQCLDFGTASLLTVRDAFKSIFKATLYTIFVLAAVYHGFNGFWTFMITWGIVLKMRSQSRAVNLCVGLMLLIGFLGLASIWGTYFINLRN